MSSLLKYDNVNVEASRILYNNVCPKKPLNSERKLSGTKSDDLSNAKNELNRTKDEIIKAKDEAEIIIENAKKIIADANKYASELKIKAQKQAEREYAEAKKAGYADGIEEAITAAENKNQFVLNEIKTLLYNLDSQKSRLIEENDQNIIRLAMKIAEKVINEKISSDEELFLRVYEKAVKDMVAKKWLKLSVSKSELQVATSNSEYLLSMVSGAERIEIEVLEHAPKGTCIVETSDKIVDASINTQLDVIYNSMQKRNIGAQ